MTQKSRSLKDGAVFTIGRNQSKNLLKKIKRSNDFKSVEVDVVPNFIKVETESSFDAEVNTDNTLRSRINGPSCLLFFEEKICPHPPSPPPLLLGHPHL